MDIIPLLTADQIGVLLQGITLVGGGLAFGFGLWQYWKSQTWKRHEFVAGEYRAFISDPLARNAMLMIDWGTRDIELFPTHPDYSARFVLVKRPTLHQALVTHDKMNRPYTPTEAAIRDSFDAFFGGLERFEQVMQAKLVEPDELRPYLLYWIRAISDEVNPTLRGLLDEYVRFYHFDNIRPLFTRYQRSFGQGSRTRPEEVHQVQERYEELIEKRDSQSPTVQPAAAPDERRMD